MKCEKVFVWAREADTLSVKVQHVNREGVLMKVLHKRVVAALGRIWRDERAQAMTEYVVLMLVVCTLAFWLYHPENGFPKAFRDRYDLTMTLLMMPGP